MPVWMVTGATGFLGRHVLSALGTRVDARVVALGRRRHEPWDSGEFVTADLDDLPALTRAVAAIQPDCVIHAAGRTPPGTAESFYRSNTLATLHLLDALKTLARPVRVVLAGSAAELGPVPVEDLPVGEDQECHPHEAYGLSKWLATCAGLAARPPVEVMVGRIFNPIGPGLSTSQAFGRFAAELADPSTSALVVGDLEARRDFVDIRDVAQALVALAEQGRAGKNLSYRHRSFSQSWRRPGTTLATLRSKGFDPREPRLAQPKRATRLARRRPPNRERDRLACRHRMGAKPG